MIGRVEDDGASRSLPGCAPAAASVSAELPARERPILFSAPMVRALLDGRKTQTRRVVKPQPANDPDVWFINGNGAFSARTAGNNWLVVGCPYGGPGDLLWVRETYAKVWRDESPPESPDDVDIEYRADTDGKAFAGGWPIEERDNEDRPRWRPSIHMPRWASRITLRITDVRVERLNDISQADALAEGMTLPEGVRWGNDPIDAYAGLWNHINGPGSWVANPWVWALTFTVHPRAALTKAGA